MRPSLCIVCLLAACGAVATPNLPEQASDSPLASPPDQLLAWSTRRDRAAIRDHAWRQWQQLAAGGWSSWMRSDQVFSAAPLAPSRELAFRPPHPITLGGKPIAAPPLLYDVLLDRDAASYVREHRYQQRATVAAAGAHIPDMPTGAAAIKRVWWPIRRRGLTAMPIWDDAPTRPDTDGNPPPTWSRVVAVDPSRAVIPVDEVADVRYAGRAVRAHVVPLAQFFHREVITDRELATARVVVGDRAIDRGDYVALVAVHLTTKEIPSWTWATWWWHDRAADGPFADDRPRALTGWAASYRMDATLSFDEPCMNPWLEARFPGGLASSCGSCHQRAAIGAREFLPPPSARTPDDDAYFRGKTTTDFMWSIALEAK